MEKNNKKDNALIKRKNLILELKKEGIKRVNLKAAIFLEQYLKKYLSDMAKLLKEETLIQGRKTLKKEDVEKILEKMKGEKKGFEI